MLSQDPAVLSKDPAVLSQHLVVLSQDLAVLSQDPVVPSQHLLVLSQDGVVSLRRCEINSLVLHASLYCERRAGGDDVRRRWVSHGIALALR